LPDYFGGNFDALYDCLCDPDCLPDESCVLFIGNTQALGEEGCDILIAVLQAVADDWRDQGRSFWALFDAPGLDLTPLPA
jgi:RNAse (barnase) inhibitor barstar